MKMELWKESIFSDGTVLFVDKVNPSIGDNVEIKIRMLKNSPVEKVYIRYLVNGEETVKEMLKSEENKDLEYYKIEILVEQKLLQYHFVICTKDEMYFYNQKGLFDHIITEDCDFKIVMDLDKPNWVEKSIFYQIFTDRFFNGDEDSDVKDGEYSYNGYETSKIPWGQPAGEYEQYGSLDFYGGDLQGIEQKVKYLKELGVTAVYLNPIFEAPSNHKYDCSDYFNVDKHFGGNKALENLVKALHKEEMKILLDISINHTGENHRWFKDRREFYFTKEDGDYEKWCGVKSLPVLNYNNKELKDIMYKKENSVLKKWLNEPYSIDGWRFDVGHNVGKMKKSYIYNDIWREVRQELKNIDKEKYLLAEHWTDCGEYLQGDMWDGTMNYFGFERPTRKYLGETDWFFNWKTNNRPMKKNNANVFMNEVIQHYAKIPHQLQTIQLNLLGSHDLHRMHHSDEISRENLMCGIVMLFTFLGVPCVYYGDEVLLDGKTGKDSGFRYPMQWNEEKWDKEINQLYRKMMKLRNEEKVLQEGSLKFIDINEKTLCYARFNNEEVIVLVNSQNEDIQDIQLPLNIFGNLKNSDVILGNEKNIRKNNSYYEVKINPNETMLIKFKQV